MIEDIRGPKLTRNFAAINDDLYYKGFFAFISNYVKDPQEVLAIYRGRDCVEKTFSNLQTCLDLSSAGVHHDETLDGKLLVCLVALTMLASLSYAMEQPREDKHKGVKRRLFDDYSVNELLSELTNIRRISVPGFTARLTEIGARQLDIFNRLNVPIPLTADF